MSKEKLYVVRVHMTTEYTVDVRAPSRREARDFAAYPHFPAAAGRLSDASDSQLIDLTTAILSEEPLP